MWDAPSFVATGSRASSHQLRLVYSQLVTGNVTGTQHSPDGRPCWHRAAWRLLRKAAELVAPVRVMPSEAELQALVDELYA